MAAPLVPSFAKQTPELLTVQQGETILAVLANVELARLFASAVCTTARSFGSLPDVKIDVLDPRGSLLYRF